MHTVFFMKLYRIKSIKVAGYDKGTTILTERM